MEAKRLTRGKLAKLTRVNFETVRYYENAGMMPTPQRSVGGHRIYTESHLKRLSFIRRCRELGFNLDEIRELLTLVDGGKYTCADILEITRMHIADIRSKIQDLERMEQTLKELADHCSGEGVPECPIVETLWKK